MGLDGVIHTVAGSGILPGDNATAATAAIYDGQGLAADARGNLYFSDFLHNTIRRLATDGRVTTVAGNRQATWAGDSGPPLSASFSAPRCLQFDHHGQLLFLDETAGVAVVRAINPGADGVIDGSPDERIRTIAGRIADRSESDHGAADGRPATQAVFVAVRGFAIDSHDNLYITDWLDNRVRRVTPGADGILNGSSDEIIQTIAGTGATPSSGDGGPARLATVSSPQWTAVDPDDNVFFFEETDDANRTVRRIDGRTGVITTVLRSREIWSMAAPTTRDLYFADGTQFYRLDLGNGSVTVMPGRPMRALTATVATRSKRIFGERATSRLIRAGPSSSQTTETSSFANWHDLNSSVHYPARCCCFIDCAHNCIPLGSEDGDHGEIVAFPDQHLVPRAFCSAP